MDDLLASGKTLTGAFASSGVPAGLHGFGQAVSGRPQKTSIHPQPLRWARKISNPMMTNPTSRSFFSLHGEFGARHPGRASRVIAGRGKLQPFRPGSPPKSTLRPLGFKIFPGKLRIYSPLLEKWDALRLKQEVRKMGEKE
jgi:hypothetical protein